MILLESLIFSGMRKKLCFIKGSELVRGGFFVVFRAQDCGKRVLGRDFPVFRGESRLWGLILSVRGQFFMVWECFPWFVVDFFSNPLILLNFPGVL